MDENILIQIQNIVGGDFATSSEFEKMFYSRDVSPIIPELQEKFGTYPDIIARPRSADQVSGIVKIALANKIPIVPRGGASWWLGGSVPYGGGIVMDLTSFNDKIEIDEAKLSVRADCGVTWAELEQRLDIKGFFLGTRPGSALSATVGGWLSTGGVGFGSYRYGGAGDLVMSLEVVLPSGEIIETGGEGLSNIGSGYDLNRMFVGAEGTLGIITKATLRILPKPRTEPNHISYAFTSLQKCQEALKDLVNASATVHHVALGDKNHFEILTSTGHKVPKADIVLCVTFINEPGEEKIENPQFNQVNKLMLEAGAKVECDHQLMKECNDCTIEFRGWGSTVHPVPGEIFVGIDRLEEAVTGIYALCKELNLKSGIIGSLVDRRTIMLMPYHLHDPKGNEPFLQFHRRLEKLASGLGGRRVGLGLYFSHSINNIRSKEAVGLMQTIKHSLDPEDIMNPGKTLRRDDLFDEDQD